MLSKKIFKVCEVSKESDCLVVVRFYDGADLKLLELQEIMDFINRESDLGYVGVLFVTSDRLSVENNVFKFDFFNSFSNNIRAQAFVIDSLSTRFLVNFYLSCHKSPIETNVFSSELPAVRWLTEQLELSVN